jgi:hypothetical protein
VGGVLRQDTDMDTKKCSKCGIEKGVQEFSKQKASKDGLQPKCKSCVAEYDLERYRNNKEKFSEKAAEYYKNNKEKFSEKAAEYRENNKEKIRIS